MRIAGGQLTGAPARNHQLIAARRSLRAVETDRRVSRGANRHEGYAALRRDLLADIRARGVATVFAERGRDVVRLFAIANPSGSVEPDVFGLIGADPRVWEYLSHLPREVVSAERARAAGPARRERPIAGHAGSGGFGAALKHWLRDHHELREGDGTPMQFVEQVPFQNWGRTVSNVPALTVVPRTKAGVSALVRWASAKGYTVRAAGYRHSWSDVFSADGQVLVSMLPPYDRRASSVS